MTLNQLTGKKVEINADGILYTGVLMEVSGESVEIRTETQWLSIPMDKVSSITEIE